MDNLYSKFYVGRQNPFGMGTWDSNMKRKLNHSISQPYLSQNSTHSKNLILPPVGSKYDNGAKKYKNRGLLNKLSGKLKNFTNTDSYKLREFIYKNFDTFIKNPEIKQKLELSLEYKKNFIKKTKLIFSNYTNGLPFSEKRKFFLKTIFNRF